MKKLHKFAGPGPPPLPTGGTAMSPLQGSSDLCIYPEPQRQPVKIAIVEDDPDDRILLGLTIGRLQGLRLVTSFATGEEALKSPAIMEVQVVLMDIRMPGMGGIACTRLLKKTLPALKILMLTGTDDPALLWEAFVAGANGFVNKPLSEIECSAAINLALAGGLPISRAVMLRVVASSNSGARIPLTARQNAVAKCMAKGMGNKQIAAELGLSLYGTKKSIHAIFVKLNASSRTDAVNRLHGRIV